MTPSHSYHHGNLKPALLAAALDIIRQAGPQAFTLREVARRAGVSHNAPYRHFRNKEDLLAALAAEGFDQLSASMVKMSESASGAFQRLRMAGLGYVDFALRHPQHFTIIFDVSIMPGEYPATQAAGARAFGMLLSCVEACQAEGVLPGGDPQPFALLAWSMVHGVAKLAISGRLPLADSAQVLQFTDSATRALWRGLAGAFTPEP